jgi:hypothetical protein
MKNFGKLAVLGAALAVSATYAFATPIIGSAAVSDFGGSYNNTSGTLNFGSTGAISGIAGSTITTYFTLGNPVAFQTPFAYSPTVGNTLTVAGSTSTTGGQLVFSTVENGETLDYYETSLTTDLGTSGVTNYLDLSGTGYFTELCSATCTGSELNYAATAATFSLAGSSTDGLAFQVGGTATTPVIPEPNSLMLLGTGLLSAGGMLMRRRRLTA